MARAGSPSAWVETKTMIETMKSTRTPRSTRRTINAASPPPDVPPASFAMARSGEPDGAVPVTEGREVQRALARLQPLDLRGVAVEEAAEERDDVAAGVVLLLLHLVLELHPLRVVGGGERLVVEVLEVRSGARLRRPVRLVVRRARQRALLDLVEVAAGAPEVHRERQLEVAVAVVVRVLDHIHRDARRLCLLGEDRGDLDHAGRTVGGVQVDGHAVLAGGLEQRLRLVDVLRPLREVLGVPLVEGCVEV